MRRLCIAVLSTLAIAAAGPAFAGQKDPKPTKQQVMVDTGSGKITYADCIKNSKAMGYNDGQAAGWCGQRIVH